jgi:c-di-GMP-related signal transduction protein
MTDLEQQVFAEVRAIIANEEQVLGRRATLVPLKKAIIADGDIRNVIDIVSTDPALAAHLLWRSNCAMAPSLHPNRSLKDALVRLGQVNIYRYALTEAIATEAVDSLHQMQGVSIDADEVQTLALFSVFGQVIALTAFAYLNAEQDQCFPLSIIKSLIDTQQKSLTLGAFEALGLDDELQHEFMIAHNLRQTRDANSAGLVLRRILAQRGLLLNSL